MSEEKTITIRIPEHLHRKIKIRAAEQGVSLKDYLVNLVEKDLKNSESKKN